LHFTQKSRQVEQNARELTHGQIALFAGFTYLVGQIVQILCLGSNGESCRDAPYKVIGRFCRNGRSADRANELDSLVTVHWQSPLQRLSRFE
jgi:hypothetical protein